MSETVEITRYPNRRLYDRNHKTYVTVGEIETMVLAGHEVRVRDSKSGEDLTRVILTQILLERHPERMKMFPVAFLHAILRADRLALDWMAVYFGQAMTFLKGITGSPRNGTPGFDFWRTVFPQASQPLRETTSPSGVVEPQPAEPSASSSSGGEGAAIELAAKLAEMEQRLNQLEAKSPEAEAN
jgi:polyhydroxyalkanoate synthesis repressor PhaR